MNSREKEVLEYLYDNEQAVIKELEKQYRKTLADIEERIRILQADELTQSKMYQLEYQRNLKKQIDAILEKLHADEYSTIQQYLNDSYTNAFVGTMYDLHGQGIPLLLPIDQEAAVAAILTDSKLSDSLYDSLGVDVNNMKKSIRQEITRGIAGGMSYIDIARNIQAQTKSPFSRVKTIVNTEGHRITQASAQDARKVSRSKGADVVKQWDSTLDGKTRRTHRELDGQIREIDEPFEMNGQKAMYPGDFGDPAEDCNCRCVALTRSRSALDESELETLKQRAEYFGLDKTKELEEFKEKYINAAKTIEKTGKSSIIKGEHGFANEQLQQRHYEKHSDSFSSLEEYLSMANALANADLSGDVVELIRSDNSVSKYCFSTNEFLVISEDGTIRTFFKPENGKDYWQYEIDRNQ